MLIDRVGDLTHPIPVFPDDTIRDELVHEVIIGIKTHAVLIRDDTHQEFFKPRVPSDIRSQMIDVGVPFPQELLVCLCKVRHGNDFGFRDVQFFSKNLGTSIHKERLSGSLFMETFNHLWCKGLPDFGILSEEVVDFFECKVGQSELILDIKWRDRPIPSPKKLTK